MTPARPHGNQLRKHRLSLEGCVYLVTAVCWQRKSLFAKEGAGRLVLDEIHQSDQRMRSNTIACVVMPDHLHWLFQLPAGQQLSKVVGQIKGRSARAFNKRSNRTGPVWQSGYHDHAVRWDEEFERLADYVVHNPVRAGIVDDVDDYPLWDVLWQRRSHGDRG